MFGLDLVAILFGSVDALRTIVYALVGLAAVYQAVLKPGDCILSMDLRHGGHLSHGHLKNISGMTYKIVHYGLHPETERIDYDEVRRLAQEHRPRMVVAGYSAYSREIDWSVFAGIARMLQDMPLKTMQKRKTNMERRKRFLLPSQPPSQPTVGVATV